jgi:ribonucleoside-diphosphate reductase alpha chain
MDISHPEIEEFLFMRKSSGGDANRKCLNLHHGINITDEFMNAVSKNIDWKLIDPHSKKVSKSINARELWRLILETRHETGEPYLHFVDTSNRSLLETQKKLGLSIKQSNLCSEITLPTDEDRTAVCCLSSVNLAKYDEWSTSSTFIPDMVRMLDNVLEHFIQATYDFSYDYEGEVLDMKVKKGMEGFTKAGYSAYRERSLGLGAMGFHTYLQKLNVPFEGPIATGQNLKMFKQIKELANKTSMELAEERGEAPDMEGTGMRNAHLLAVAPNATSSIICGGTSPSIEPIRANVFIHKTLNGSFQVRNRQLHNLLKQKWNNSEELQKEYDSDYQHFKDKIWQSISENTGSVKHLDFLTDLEKDVFKTADEIDQNWVIEHASKRQEFICQAQSVNLFFVAPRVQAKQEEHDNFLRYTNKVHYQAWKKGLKSLYYLRSREGKSAENINLKVKRVRLEQEATEEECLSCEA